MNKTKSQMHPKAAKQLQKLNQDLTLLLEVLKDYSEETLNKKPSENQWSVLQVMHHLMLIEGYGLSYVKKKLSYNPTLDKAGIAAMSRSFLMNLYLKLPIKVKAPEAVSGDNLPSYSSFWETAKNWKDQRAELSELLSEMPIQNFNKELYKHALAGKMTLFQMLDFYQTHFNRHRKQINKILAKSFKIKD